MYRALLFLRLMMLPSWETLRAEIVFNPETLGKENTTKLLKFYCKKKEDN